MPEEKKMLFSQDALRKLLWPLIIEQFLAIAMGMADTVMAASCGEAVVSGISLVDSICVLLIGLFTAMASGGAVVAAQYMGHGDKEMVGPSVSVGVCAVHLLLEVDILYHIRRMLQFALQLEALHCEQSAQAAWHGQQRAGVMRGAVGGSEVVDEVVRGHNGESGVHHHRCPEYRFVVFLARRAMVVAGA